MKKELKTIAITSLTLSALFACNSGNTNSANGDKGKDTAKVVTTISTTNADNDLLPNLIEIGSILKNSGLNYIPGLTNPISDVSRYNTAYERELNLGIYFADLAYCTMNKQNQQSIDYLKAVKTIADDIGINQVFESNTLFQRYQSNLNNEDSLQGLVVDMQEKTDTVLKINKLYSIRVIIYSGAWVENMYIGTKVYSKSKNSNPAGNIVQQMTILENMLKILNDYKASDTTIQGLYTDMKLVDDTYQGFAETKNYNPDSKPPFTFTDEHIKKLSDVLEGLHTKFIK